MPPAGFEPSIPASETAVDPRLRARGIVLKGDDSTLIQLCLIASLFIWTPMVMTELRQSF